MLSSVGYLMNGPEICKRMQRIFCTGEVPCSIRLYEKRYLAFEKSISSSREADVSPHDCLISSAHPLDAPLTHREIEFHGYLHNGEIWLSVIFQSVAAATWNSPGATKCELTVIGSRGTAGEN